jgi:hypothetical protein
METCPLKKPSAKFLISAFIIILVVYLPLSSDDLRLEKGQFYEFLDNFYENLAAVTQAGDSSFSERTNLEIKTRKWNDYLTDNLPKRFYVKVPIDKVSIGKETFNRSDAEVQYDFHVNMPVEYFQFKNNVSGRIFKIRSLEFSENDQNFLRLEPGFEKFRLESNLARKLKVLDKNGHLIFEITMSITREAGWLQYYQTIISFESVQWYVEDELLWELESLPFEEILLRDK